MKSKLFTVFLAIVFICLLLFINSMLNEQNTSINSDVKKNFESEESSNMDVLKVSSENFEEEVLKSDKKVLIDFYAEWCGPCKMLSPIVEQVATENTNIKVVKINIDENEDLAVKYGVSSIPTLVVVENGETKKINVGLISKSEVEELVK